MLVAARRLLFCSLALVVGSAGATTLVAMDVPALTKGSKLVVRAVVVSQASRWSKDGGRIMTDTVLSVSETWKGPVAPQVTVMQPGGVVDDIGQKVHGTVTFKVGEEVVLFLEGRGDRFLITGMVQGRFKVDRSSDGRSLFARQASEDELMLVDAVTHQPVEGVELVMPLETLRTQVLAVVAKEGSAGTGTTTTPRQVTP